MNHILYAHRGDNLTPALCEALQEVAQLAVVQVQRQCGTCAYRGKFADAPDFVQQGHIDFMEDGETEGPHGCHEHKGRECIGCARWFKEARLESVFPSTRQIQQQAQCSHDDASHDGHHN